MARSVHHGRALHGAALHGRSTSHYRFAARFVQDGRAFHTSWAPTSGISCVPYARANSGIEITGNAATWWDHAAGVYARGAKPEVGSILNFRATGRMELGHVAVVSNVINGREVEVDHANWNGRGAVSLHTRVIDVSPANDWTEVRVALDQRPDFGSVYATYGFIYDRPDTGVMLANTNSGGTVQMTSAVGTAPLDEVAELPPGRLVHAVALHHRGRRLSRLPRRVAKHTRRHHYR